MPVAYVDIPAGVNDSSKRKIFTELYEAIHQAWPIPDTRVLIREWTDEAVSQDGRFLYVLVDGRHTIAGFRIGADGSLRPLGEAGTLPAGSVGLASS